MQPPIVVHLVVRVNMWYDAQPRLRHALGTPQRTLSVNQMLRTRYVERKGEVWGGDKLQIKSCQPFRKASRLEVFPEPSSRLSLPIESARTREDSSTRKYRRSSAGLEISLCDSAFITSKVVTATMGTDNDSLLPEPLPSRVTYAGSCALDCFIFQLVFIPRPPASQTAKGKFVARGQAAA